MSAARQLPQGFQPGSSNSGLLSTMGGELPPQLGGGTGDVLLGRGKTGEYFLAKHFSLLGNRAHLAYSMAFSLFIFPLSWAMALSSTPGLVLMDKDSRDFVPKK